MNASKSNINSAGLMQSPKLGELLLSKSAISDADLQKALGIQATAGGLLGSILIRVGAISEDILLQALSEQLGQRIVGVDVHLPEFHEIFIGMDSTEIDFDWYLDHGVIHWPEEGKVVCCSKSQTHLIKDTMNYFFPSSAIEFSLISSQELEALLDLLKKEKSVDDLINRSGSDKALRELAEEAPVVELVNNILAQAINTDSSDVHIEPEEESFTVRFRTDGVLYTRFKQPIDRFPAVASRIKLVSGLDIAERRLPQDGRITTRISGADMDIRVSTVPGVNGESIVMRLLPKEREEIKLGNLGLEADHLKLVSTAITESNGMFLVTGPTGSGKSTTLSGALGAANDGKKKIISVEDPVEFVVPGVTQIQAHAEIGYTFAKALRAILRQDPDVIMVGEIRDKETAEIAIQSAMTGHLVLSTVHTNDALSVFARLTDMGVEPFLVAAPMKLVQAQRLVRRLCDHCKVPAQVDKQFDLELAKIKPVGKVQWSQAKGCERCLNVGYRGRLGIYEIYPIDSEVRDLVVGKAPASEIKAVVARKGHRSLYEDGLLKAARGITSIDEVIRVSSGIDI